MVQILQSVASTEQAALKLRAVSHNQWRNKACLLQMKTESIDIYTIKKASLTKEEPFWVSFKPSQKKLQLSNQNFLIKQTKYFEGPPNYKELNLH